jgi:hypothetical protein
MDQTDPEFFMKSYRGSGNGRDQGLGRRDRSRGRAAGVAPQGPRHRVRAAEAAAGEP